MLRLLALAFFMLLLQGLCTYLLYVRWFKPPVWPFGKKRLLLSLMGTLCLLMPLGHFCWSRFYQAWAGALYWLGCFWLGILLYAFCTVVLADLALLLVRIFRKPSLRLRRQAAALSALVALGLCSYGAFVVAKGPQVKEREVVLEKLSPAFDGFRVAVVADAHLGTPGLGRAFSERLVAQINALEADVVALVGDMVDRDVESLVEAVAPLQNLRAKHGVLVVMGNHEYFHAPLAWIEHFKSLGLRVLGNERVELERMALVHPEADTAVPVFLAFAGVHDLFASRMGHRSDLQAALEGWEKATPLVLLSHQPRLWKEAREAGVDLMLSGHTHGGQLWPLHYASAQINHYVQGLYREQDAQLYVTTGAGHWGPPMRIGAPPEIALLRLRSPAQKQP